jgi:hypothetical protein
MSFLMIKEDMSPTQLQIITGMALGFIFGSLVFLSNSSWMSKIAGIFQS